MSLTYKLAASGGNLHLTTNNLHRGIFFLTSGITGFAEYYDAYWIINFILGNQQWEIINIEDFQVWEFKPINDDLWSVIVSDGNGNIILQNTIKDNKLPKEPFKIWLNERTLLFPEEF